MRVGRPTLCWSICFPASLLNPLSARMMRSYEGQGYLTSCIYDTMLLDQFCARDCTPRTSTADARRGSLGTLALHLSLHLPFFMVRHLHPKFYS